jgi:hypothetical protein
VTPRPGDWMGGSGPRLLRFDGDAGNDLAPRGMYASSLDCSSDMRLLQQQTHKQ